MSYLGADLGKASISKRLFNILLLVLLIITLSFIIFFWWQIRRPFSNKNLAQEFKVQRGESVKSVSRRLLEDGLIKNSFYFQLYVFLAGKEFAIQPGKFGLNYNLSIRDIVDIISKASAEEIIVIPEGYTLRDVSSKLSSTKILQTQELERFKIGDFKNHTILKDAPANASLEGYLFPDTYRFYENSEARDVVLRFLNNLNSKLPNSFKEEILRQHKKFFDILTMASLLEKEARGLENQKVVSGILWKRIKLGMPLQVDATLVYITGKNEALEADKKLNSPYNTYYRSGLPTGPIANPGLGAIKAAILPTASPWLYYLSTKDGRMIYSITLEEHNLAKAKYLH